MDFSYTPKVEALRAELLRFFDESIYPNESTYLQEVQRNRAAGNAWIPIELIEQLKPKAREQGLWNLFRREIGRASCRERV